MNALLIFIPWTHPFRIASYRRRGLLHTAKGVSIRNSDENKIVFILCIHPMYSSSRRSFLLQIRRTSIQALLKETRNQFVRSFFAPFPITRSHPVCGHLHGHNLSHVVSIHALRRNFGAAAKRKSPSGLCEETLSHGGSSCLSICNRRDPAWLPFSFSLLHRRMSTRRSGGRFCSPRSSTQENCAVWSSRAFSGKCFCLCVCMWYMRGWHKWGLERK